MIAAGVHTATSRTIGDGDRLRAALRPGRKVVIVGGGWVGLEAAAVAAQLGVEVTVVERSDVPLARVVGPAVAAMFMDSHRSHGVRLRTGVRVPGVRRDGVMLGTGERVPADMVLIAVGACPNTDIAECAGLRVDDGVLVDATLATSDPDVVAAVDVANHDHPVLGRIRGNIG
jgi:3-phenylpropionate/trans-cinnamate dioxygenase ferredoxin reductase subunit